MFIYSLLVVLLSFLILPNKSLASEAPNVAFVEFHDSQPYIKSQKFSSIEEFNAFKQNSLPAALVIHRAGTNKNLVSFESVTNGSVNPIIVTTKGSSLNKTTADLERLDATVAALIIRDTVINWGGVGLGIIVGGVALMILIAAFAGPVSGLLVLGSLPTLLIGAVMLITGVKFGDKLSLDKKIHSIIETTQSKFEAINKADVLIIPCKFEWKNDDSLTCDDYYSFAQTLINRTNE